MNKPAPRPFEPPVYDEFVTASARAFFAGNASEPQQKRLLEWLLFEVCEISNLSFRPDSARETDFAEGKRFVGLQLVKMTKIPPGSMSTTTRENERRDRGRRR